MEKKKKISLLQHCATGRLCSAFLFFWCLDSMGETHYNMKAPASSKQNLLLRGWRKTIVSQATVFLHYSTLDSWPYRQHKVVSREPITSQETSQEQTANHLRLHHIIVLTLCNAGGSRTWQVPKSISALLKINAINSGWPTEGFVSSPPLNSD